MRSRPAPVSICGVGSGVRDPSGAWSYCMKTRFQNSMKRSPWGSWSGPPSGPKAGPRSMCSSLDGPHGPVSPICQKLSLSPRRWMRSIGTPTAVVPDLLRLVVALVDGDPDAVAVEPPLLGDQLPRVGDRQLLEVAAEAEVAEHLEEHEVALGATDLVEVVVLAAGAGALLRAHRVGERRLLVADEVGLERHHAGDVEQHRRVVRDQARRRDHRVRSRGEEVDERLAELVGGARGVPHGSDEPICGVRTGLRGVADQ